MKLFKHKLVMSGLVLAAASLMMAGCGGFRSGGGLSEDPGGTIANAKYVGDAACKTCHGETHMNWLATRHSKAFTSLKTANQQRNAYCLGCHTVGYKKGGFVDEATTPNLGGVQCESCHGPGSEHRGDPRLIKLSTSADLCGQCHKGTHSHFMEEWSQSAHATALATLKARSSAQTRCLECHSADYRSAKERGKPTPTLATAKDPVTCSVCHNPHSNAINEAQLRTEPSMLCTQCHNDEGATPASTTNPHHTQAEMLDGNGHPAGEVRGVHSRFAEKCITCHVYSREYISDSDPAIRGHEFLVNLKSCSPCHDETEAAEHLESIHTEISAKMTALKARLDTVTDATQKSNPLYREALFSYNFVLNDKSKGVHNPRYTRTILTYANTKLTELGVP